MLRGNITGPERPGSRPSRRRWRRTDEMEPAMVPSVSSPFSQTMGGMVESLLCQLGAPSIARRQIPVDASLTFGGVDGPPWPIVLPINTATWGVPLAVELRGAPIQAFLVDLAPAGMLASGIATKYG